VIDTSLSLTKRTRYRAHSTFYTACPCFRVSVTSWMLGVSFLFGSVCACLAVITYSLNNLIELWMNVMTLEVTLTQHPITLCSQWRNQYGTLVNMWSVPVIVPSNTEWICTCIHEWWGRLCGLVVRVLSYRSGGPVSIPGTTRKKVVDLERSPLSLVSTSVHLLLSRKLIIQP
jgi:hypothetical protein